MEKRLISLLMVLVAVVALAGTSLSGELRKVVGNVLEFDREKGVMVVAEDKDTADTRPTNKITVTDNERMVLRKNEDLKVGVKVNVKYEESGEKNFVKTFFIIPGGC